MKKQSGIGLLRNINEAFAGLLTGLSVEQVNAIPAGFNNNIIWNFAHSLAMQQIYFYQFSGLPYIVDEAFVNRYKKGTKPEGNIEDKEINGIIQLFANSIHQFEKDYEGGVFKNYENYITSIGYVINSIDAAIQVALFHDGWHFGVVKTLKKLVLPNFSL